MTITINDGNDIITFKATTMILFYSEDDARELSDTLQLFCAAAGESATLCRLASAAECKYARQAICEVLTPDATQKETISDYCNKLIEYFNHETCFRPGNATWIQFGGGGKRV